LESLQVGHAPGERRRLPPLVVWSLAIIGAALERHG